MCLCIWEQDGGDMRSLLKRDSKPSPRKDNHRTQEKCSVFFSHSQRIVTHNKVGLISYVTSAQVLSVCLSRNDNSSVWAVIGGVLEYNYYIIRKKLKMTHFLKYHE